MTEQEFRDALKESVGHTGLSSERQMKVLAGMKGEEPKVRTWSKLKVSLILAVVVIMTMGAAVATEIVKYVNWDGEPVDYMPPEYQTLDVSDDTLRDPIADEEIRKKRLEEVLIFYYNGLYQPGKSEGHRVEVDSLAELTQLAGDDSLLPVPVGVPEGFKLVKSQVYFAVEHGTTYQLISEEYIKSGVSVKRYTCDRDRLRMCSYFLFFENNAGERLNFSAKLVMDYNADSVLQANGAQVNVEQVEGIDQAVSIDEGDHKFIWMRKNLLKPIAAQIIILGPDALETPETDHCYVCMELQINSTVCDLDTMLASFDLTTQ